MTGIRQRLLEHAGSGDSPVINRDESPQDHAPDKRWDHDWGEHIVRVSVGFSSRDGLAAARMECVDDEFYFRSDVLECTVPESAIERLESHSDIRYVEEPIDAEPTEWSWGHERIMADLAYVDDVTGSTADIAIVDSGINSTHPALQPNIGTGHVVPDVPDCDESCPDDAVDCTETWDDDEGHGTRMAGVAAAIYSDASGEYSGVATGATLHAVRVRSCSGPGGSTAVAQGIEWSADENHDIINVSLAFESSPSVVEDACQYAYDNGSLIVASAGNDYGETVKPPAAYNTTLGVSATAENDDLASFSNEGARVDLAAPGEDIIGSTNYTADNGWAQTGGTSAAAAFVSGVAALTVDNRSSSDPDEIFDYLTNTAEDLGLPDTQQGAGLVNAVDASGATYVEVATLPATDVEDTQATINADVVEVEGVQAIEIAFEYREVNDDEWTLSSTTIWDATEGDGLQQEFSTTLLGLNREDDYEFRARVWTGENDYYGAVETFTTTKGYGWPDDADARSLTTDAAGEGTFADLPHGEWEVQAATNAHEVLHESHDHQGEGSWTLWLDPRGTEFNRSAPDVGAFFEVAALSSRAGDDWQIDALVSNTGTNPGEEIVTLETPDGTTVARHHVALNGLESARVPMSVRSALEGQGTADVILSTTDDEEHLMLRETGHVPAIIGSGQPRTAGGPIAGTAGGALPTTAGRERDHSETDERDIARKEGAFAITLENMAGARREITDVIKDSGSFDPAHTEISQWSFTTPADPTLDSWDYQCRAYITSNERLLAVGWVRSINTDRGNQETTIKGRGPAHEINGGPLAESAEWSHGGKILKWRAIERCAAALVPEWDIDVVPPADPIVLEDPSVSGSAWDCLVDLCEPGFRLSVNQQQFRQATIFPPGGVVRNKVWDPFDDGLSRESSRGSYFPAAEVQSEQLDEPVEYTDWNAVERLAREQNITEREARQVYPITDDDIETETEALAEAQGKVRELTDENAIGGSIETWAEFLPPGASYPMPWDGAHKQGIYALEFESGGGVDLPGRTMRPLDRTGAVTMWVKAPWSDLSADEVRLFGTRRSGGEGGIRTIGEGGIEFFAGNRAGDRARINATDGFPTDDEWVFLHFDWEYDENAGETTVRAGMNGDITETATTSGALQTPRTEADTLTLGRWQNYHFRGTMDTVSLWRQPPTEAQYGTLAKGGTIPATHLASRYPMDEGPQMGTDVVYDEVGGYHGIRNDKTRPSGNPQTLRSQSIDGLTMTAEFSRSMTYKEALKEALRD